MELILLHLIGDYITQTEWMASNKASSSFAAFVHATVYAIPFWFVGSLTAVSFILITHFFIDRYRLARFVTFAKNWITQPSMKWADVHSTGYPKEVPVWMATWMLIIVDNTLHLACNYVAVMYM